MNIVGRTDLFKPEYTVITTESRWVDKAYHHLMKAKRITVDRNKTNRGIEQNLVFN